MMHWVVKNHRPDRCIPYASQILHSGSISRVVVWITSSFRMILFRYRDAPRAPRRGA